MDIGMSLLGFRFQYPRLKFLSRCLQGRRSSPPLRFTHIKPRHVTHSDREIADTYYQKMALVHQFISNLQSAGFGALLVHRRHNTLAMLISDYELKFKRRDVRYSAFEKDFSANMVDILKYNYMILEEGRQHAIHVGLPVIETNFTALTGDDSCGEYTKIFLWLNTLDFGISPELTNNCTKV